MTEMCKSCLIIKTIMKVMHIPDIQHPNNSQQDDNKNQQCQLSTCANNS